MQYVLDENNSDGIVEHAFTKHESIQVHVDIQITEYCQHGHCKKTATSWRYSVTMTVSSSAI